MTATRSLSSPFCHFCLGSEVVPKCENSDDDDVHLPEQSDLLDVRFAKRFKSCKSHEQRMILETLVSEVDAETLTTELAYQIAVRHVEPAVADMVQPTLVGVINAVMPSLTHAARSTRSAAPCHKLGLDGACLRC